MTPIERLRERERLAELGGGDARRQKQHDQGKLTARERMTRLFDPGTFEEVDKLVTHRCQSGCCWWWNSRVSLILLGEMGITGSAALAPPRRPVLRG